MRKGGVFDETIGLTMRSQAPRRAAICGLLLTGDATYLYSDLDVRQVRFGQGAARMVKPTLQDAELMLRLQELMILSGAHEAKDFLWSREFNPDYDEFEKNYPAGSDGDILVSKVCGFFETVGTLHKHGLVNEELLFDWLVVSLVWERVEGWARARRERSGEPRLFENFEKMARAGAEYDA
jgi:hypothetical protein